MASFDPYRKWLGIPSEEQPPHHYRLLGIGLFESDSDVIANAADRQMTHVRTFQSGKYTAQSQRILNELAAARICLLDAQKRAVYDAALKLKQPASPAMPLPPMPPGPGMPPSPGVSAGPGMPHQTPPPHQASLPPGSVPRAVVASSVIPAIVDNGIPTDRGASSTRSYPTRRRGKNWQIPVIALGVAAVGALALALVFVMDQENSQPETRTAPERRPEPSLEIPEIGRKWASPRPERNRPQPDVRDSFPAPSPRPAATPRGFAMPGPLRLGEIASMQGHIGPVLSAAFSPDGLFAVTGGQDKTVRLWDPVAGYEVRQLPDAVNRVVAIEFSYDGRFVYALTGQADTPGGSIRVWDAGLGGSPKVIPVAEGRQVHSLAIDLNGELAVVGCHDGSIRLIDLGKQAEVRAFSGHVGPVHAVVFSRDGAGVISGGEDGAVLAFQRDTGAEVRRFAGHRGPVRAVTVAPDGSDAASAGDDQMVRLWDLRGNKARAELRGHEQAVTSVAYTATGECAVSVDRGGRLIVWQMPQLCEQQRFEVPGDPILAVAVAPDGSRAVMACQDGVVRLWGLVAPSDLTVGIATSAPGEGDRRSAVPAEESRKRWRERIRTELLKADFAAAEQPDQKAALAKQLIQRAGEPQEDTAAAYAFFDAAIELAVEVDDFELALLAIDSMAKQYDVDGPTMKLAQLQTIATKAPDTIDRNALADWILEAADEAVTRDQFDVAKQLIELARTTLGTLDDASAHRNVEATMTRLNAIRQAYDDLADARHALAERPRDPQASLAIGKYECFTKGNWPAGLPLLAQGTDEQLAQIATSELKKLTDTASIVTLADDWWQAAEGEPAGAQEQIRWHAATWYKQVESKLSDGKVRAQVRTRILATGKPAASVGPVESPPAIADLAACRTEQNRTALLRYYGGGDQTEAAVQMALVWIAAHQFPDGSWNFDHRGPRDRNASADPGALDQAPNTATALALLPLLSAGHGPRRGEFRRNVGGGLNFLRSRMTPVGTDAATLYEPQAGFLPSHAIATCALCEAVALTTDAQSQKSAQNAVNFLVNTQNTDGGWSLKPSLPDQPSGSSDFFATAWSVTALKTAQWSGLRVPETKLKLASSYFDNLRAPDGSGFLRERRDGRANPTATAAGALSQLYLGRAMKRLELLQLVADLAAQGPALAGEFYQNLCMAQVMREVGGLPWTTFSTALRDHLLEAQANDGPEKGSWYLESVGWGNHVGGRLFCTALATLTLESYYRFPPLDLNPKK